MHDGSLPTLRDVVVLYSRGARKNPNLDYRIAPVNLTEADIDALVSMLEALNGEGYQELPPVRFPQ
jgi:cytochrome c peroxidase